MKPLGASDPREVGRYRVIAELGVGAMGRVLLGYGADGRLVAVKQVRPQLADDDGFRARFHREVTASRKVSGAYTAAVLDADADAPIPWLASVFIPGPSLREAVDGTGPLPEDAVLRLAAGLAAALAEIHRVGLVHRDLKPSNVLLTEDGPRVIDFGIARAAESDGSTELTRAGWLVGSPGFMSPEQAEGRPLTPASDVFSLGCVLVMACTGQSPFAGPSMPRIVYNLVHSEPDLTAIPQRVRLIIQSCLAKDPTSRPAPAQLLEMIGPIAPSARPWPPQVHRLIAKQHADVARLLSPSDEHPTPSEDEGAILARTRLQLSPSFPDNERPTEHPHTQAQDTKNGASEGATTAVASVQPVPSAPAETRLAPHDRPGERSTAEGATHTPGRPRFNRRRLILLLAISGVVILLAAGLPLILSLSHLTGSASCAITEGSGTPQSSSRPNPSPPPGTPPPPSLIAPADQAVFTLGQPITLEWTNASKVSMIALKFEDKGWAYFDSRPESGCVFTPSKPGLYQWSVATANQATGAVRSAWSEGRYFLVQPTTGPTIKPVPDRPHPPSLLAPADQAVFSAGQSVTLTWTTPAPFSSVTIVSPDGTPSGSAWQAAKSYTFTPSTRGTYRWAVFATNDKYSDHNSAESEGRYLLVR